MQLVDALKMVANLQNEFDAYIEKIRDKADKSKFYISEKYNNCQTDFIGIIMMLS